ncbi:MAG: hypothetical protein Q4F95_02835 [Oscillospiraceae bacterium]|nr:hypothetical protein [Oscillospiraceae bacterium]
MDKSFSVFFLDKTYRFPEGLNTYLGLLRFFLRMQEDLCYCAQKKAESAKNRPLSTKDIMPEIDINLHKVISILSENGIDNRTLSDYTDNSKGLKDFEKVCNARSNLTGMSSLDINSDSSNPEKSAEKKFSTTAASMAYEYSCYKREQNNNNSENQKNNIENDYLEEAKQHLTHFVYEVMDLFMVDVINAEKFHEEVLRHADFRASQAALGQLKVNADKQSVLEKAFILCPYNENIYDEILKRNMLNAQTYKTANYFCPDIKIAQQIFDMCTINDVTKKYSAEYKRISPYLPILSAQLRLSENATVKFMFNKAYGSFVKTFETLEKIPSYSKKEMKEFVSKNISNEGEYIYSLSQGQIELTMQTFVKTRIDMDNYGFLLSHGFKFEKIPAQVSVENYFASKISQAVVAYIAECRTNRRKLEDLKSTYEGDMNIKTNNILLLEMELSDTGVFALQKKKELKEKLASAKKEAEEYKTSSAYPDEKDKFDSVYI